LINTGGCDLRRAAIEAQNTKTAPFFRYERSFGGLSYQVAYGLTKRQAMALRVRLCQLHRIFFELERRSRHVSIISRM
jgi:hypothetical protein